MFAAEIRRQRVSRLRGIRNWRRHLGEVLVKINGERLCCVIAVGGFPERIECVNGW